MEINKMIKNCEIGINKIMLLGNEDGEIEIKCFGDGCGGITYVLTTSRGDSNIGFCLDKPDIEILIKELQDFLKIIK